MGSVTRSAQAVVLAAGKGTRMRSRRAKVLHTALGAPLLEHVLRTVEATGAEPVTIVVGHEAEAVEERFGTRAGFVHQDPPLGTGHALQAARERFAVNPGRTLLVVNGDLPLLRSQTLLELLDAHARAAAAATLLTAHLEDAGDYGRVVRGEDGEVAEIVEARDAPRVGVESTEINVGAYAFEVPALLGVLGRLSRDNAQGEYYLTDLMRLLAADGERVSAYACADRAEARGVNSLAELAAATRLLRCRRAHELMASGVVIEDPDSTTIGLDVVVEAEAVIRPFTMLEGRSVVRAGASIGPFARLVDVEVGIGAQILDHCLLRECAVGAEASVGPFAHVRPESRIGARARVGNFVELKKTDLGADSKANHLSYLGDASIGPSVNIGAGTITCNYDGTRKHPTRIEAGAFIGSDTTLVAPVTVGEGAYVAAGSAITEDVPPDALGLGRARQVVKPGWAKARRARAKAGDAHR